MATVLSSISDLRCSWTFHLCLSLLWTSFPCLYGGAQHRSVFDIVVETSWRIHFQLPKCDPWKRKHLESEKIENNKPVILSSITLATQFIDTIFSSLHVTKRMKFAKSRATRKIAPQAGRYHAVVAHGVELLGQNHEFLGVFRGIMS